MEIINNSALVARRCMISLRPWLLGALLLISSLRLTWANDCLSGAVPESKRVPLELTAANGSEVSIPVGVWRGGWASTDLLGEIVGIIAEEVLGLQVTRFQGTSSVQGVYALLGCKDPFNSSDRGCPDEKQISAVHVFLECWSYSMYERTAKEVVPHYDVTPLGSVGYPGKDLAFVMSSNRQNALDSAGLSLEFYRSYNTSWHSPSKFFKGISAVDTARLKPCSETLIADGALSQVYLDVTGDEGGVERVGSTVQGKCWYGHWWIAPACRHDTSECIPLLSGGAGWGYDMFMQQATAHGIPVALATAASWSDYTILPRELSSLLYWWTPDTTFIDLSPEGIILPPHDPLAYANGDKRTAMDPGLLPKLVNSDLAFAAPSLYEVLQNMEVPEVLINKALKDGQQAPAGTTAKQLACDWVKANEDIWRAWVPEKTKCIPGQGMINMQEDYVTNRSEATNCNWCLAGTFSEEYTDNVGLTHVCSSCPKGQHQKVPGQTECVHCKPGRFGAENGRDTCLLCAVGRATELSGQSACAPCKPGYASSQPGQLNCVPCGQGMLAPNDSSTLCDFCAMGTFQDKVGSASCTGCDTLIVGSTSMRGSSDSSECQCPADTFMRPSAGCVPCMVGLSCPGGNQPPLQVAGFWADILDASEREYSVYKCRDDQECAGGPLASCAEGRSGISCNNCVDNHYPTDDGSCSECKGTNALPFLACAILAPLGIVLIGTLLRMDASKQQLSTLTIAMTAGQVVTAVQSLGAMQALKIAYPEPLKSLMGVLSLFTLDLELLQLPCLFSSDSPVTRFALKLIAYPCFAVVLAAMYYGSKLVRKPLEYDNLFNLNGMLLFVLFISLTLSMLLPFQCRRNPNNKLSMATNPGLTCFENEAHQSLVGLAVVGTLVYPVSIIVWTAWATRRFPIWALSPQGMKRLRGYRFLFGRFKPECYFFGVLFLVRNGLIAATPTLLVRLPAVQTLAMGSVVLVSFGLQCRLWPWRTTAANVSDASIGLLLVLLIVGASPLLEISKEEASDHLGSLLTIIVSMTLIGAMLAVVRAVYRRFVPGDVFDIFLCHHKKGAGALARQMKMIMKLKTSSAVFLDSDQLEDLELIFDTVRAKTQNLVILLSPELLTRMWCSGEIVSAHRNNIPIVPLILDGYKAPDDEGMVAITEAWTDEQRSTLLSFDITTEMIVEAYRLVVSLPSVRMERLAMPQVKEASINELLFKCKLVGKTSQKRVTAAPGNTKPRIIISGAVTDYEALSACEIMSVMLQQVLQVEVEVLRDVARASSAAEFASCFFVLLAGGLLEDPAFAQVLLAVLEGDNASGNVPDIVTASADNTFQFPTGEFYTRLEQEGLRMPGLGPEEGPMLSAAFRSLLSILALPFSPLGSQGLIEKQVAELARRAAKILQKDPRDRAKARNSTMKRASASNQSTARQKDDTVVPVLELEPSNGNSGPERVPEPEPTKEKSTEINSAETEEVMQEAF